MKLFDSKLFAVGIMLIMAALCTSCRSDETNTDFTEEGQPAVIQLNVQPEEQPDILTRAVNTDIISDLHVLIYDDNGELIGQKYQSSGSGTIKVNTKSANNCTIYIVANTGDADFFAGYDKHLEKSLTDRIYSLTTWNGLESNSNLPMTVKKAKVNIVAGNQSLGNLEVSRIAAKVALNIKVAAHSGITINDYTIHSLPLKSYYISRPLSTENITTDDNTTPGEDAANATDNAQWKDAAKVTVNATSASTTFYMFENRRGVVSSITQQKDKISTKAPARATYVEINGTIGNVTANWKVYLGANNTSNFNIKRNCTYTYNITLNDAVTTDTRVNLDLTKVTDLSTTGTANCYLASQTSTWYKFKATVRGNGAATAALISPTGVALAANAPIAPTKAELVWEAGQGTYDIKEKDLIQTVLLKDGYIYFKTGHLNEGNAVIAAKDATGTILWSWHIWKTSFDLKSIPSETYLTCTNRSSWSGTRQMNNRTLVMMNRNLGAANNNINDASAFGLYYQFGKKDPILGAADLNYNTYVKTYPTDKIICISNNDATVSNSTLKYSIEHPNVRICATGNGDGDNWIYGATVGTTAWTLSNNLWGNPIYDNLLPTYSDGTKTIYDPCPAGWKVPPQDTFTRMLNPNVSNSGYNYMVYDNSLWYTDMNSVAGSDILAKCSTINGIKLNLLSNGASTYIPKHGVIPNHINHNLSNRNSFTFWTSASISTTNPGAAYACIDFTTPYIVLISSGGRHAAMPIRCVKEDSYTKR